MRSKMALKIYAISKQKKQPNELDCFDHVRSILFFSGLHIFNQLAEIKRGRFLYRRIIHQRFDMRSKACEGSEIHKPK
jgi:hypothetical protein